MSEYIKREDVLTRLTGIFKLQAETAKAIVDAIPAADVRPVVLCRDCRSYNRPRLGFCEMHLVRMHGDDFCSYGKKREES